MDTNIKKARIIAGLSQKQVAYELGVSTPTVSDWEAGKIYPAAKNLIPLARLLGTSTDYLLGCGAEKKPFTDSDEKLTGGEGKEKTDLPKEVGLSPIKQKLVGMIDDLTDEQCKKLFGIIEEAKKLL